MLATMVMCTVREWVVVVPPLVVVVEVGVRGLVVERQVGGAGEPRQRHVGLPGAFLKDRKRMKNGSNCSEPKRLKNSNYSGPALCTTADGPGRWEGDTNCFIHSSRRKRALNANGVIMCTTRRHAAYSVHQKHRDKVA